MNKKQAEKMIREITFTVCTKKAVPSKKDLVELKKAGWTLVRYCEFGIDGIHVKGDGDEYFLAAPKTYKGGKKQTCTKYTLQDMQLFGAANVALNGGDLAKAETICAGISAKSLRNLLEEGFAKFDAENKAVLPYDDPFAVPNPPKGAAKPEPKPIVLKGAKVCITGALPGMTRETAFDRLKKVGGVPSRNMTLTTNLFVAASEHRSKKRIAAEKAIEDGRDLRIVSGHEFVEALKAAEKENEMATKKPKKPSKKQTEVKVTTARIDITPEGVKATPIESHVEKVAMEVTIETMREWCKARENVVATQANGKGACVKVHGDTKPYRDELKELGFKWSRKGFWWAKPAA